MDSGRVIDARDRFERLERHREAGPAGNGRHPVEEALEKLRSTGRLDQSDRTKLARKLSEAAAKLNPRSSKKGAALIIRRADGDNSSLRPDRFFFHEGNSHPETLAATGATWARLIEAAARLQSEAADQEGVGRDSRNRNGLRRILGGTTFLPHSATESAQPNRAVELLEVATRHIAKRIERETRLTELWRNLHDSPFSVHQLDEGQEEPPGPVPEASKLARRVGVFISNEMNDRCYFGDIGGTDSDTDWSRPTLRIGYLSKIVRIPAFCIPKEFAEDFVKDTDDQQSWDALTNFFDSETGSYNKLPDVDYSEEIGFGFLEVNVQFIMPLSLSVVPDEKDRIRITIWQSSHTVPAGFLLDTEPLNDYGVIDGFYRSGEIDFSIDPYDLYFWMPKYRYNGNFVKDSSLLFYSDYNDNKCHEKNNYIGSHNYELIMNDIDFSDFDSIEDWKEDDRYGVLFGRDDFVFTSRFDAGPLQALVRKNSLAHSFLSSYKVRTKESLEDFVLSKSEVIAESGLNYIDALADYIKNR
jgi:hypothetical protein